MNKKKSKQIQKDLERVEVHLANAEKYVVQDTNVEGSSWLHFGDWQGRSGHPSWMKNFAIPTMKKYRSRKEKALKSINNRAKDKNLTRRKQLGAS